MENATGPTIPNFKQSSPEDIGNHKVYVHLHTLYVNCRTWEHSPVPKSGYFLLSMTIVYDKLHGFVLSTTAEFYITKLPKIGLRTIPTKA